MVILDRCVVYVVGSMESIDWVVEMLHTPRLLPFFSAGKDTGDVGREVST